MAADGRATREDLSGLYVYFSEECTCLPWKAAKYVGETGRGMARHNDDSRVEKQWYAFIKTVRILQLPGYTREEREAAEIDFMVKYVTPYNDRNKPGGFNHEVFLADLARDAAAKQQRRMTRRERLDLARGKQAEAERFVARVASAVLAAHIQAAVVIMGWLLFGLGVLATARLAS